MRIQKIIHKILTYEDYCHFSQNDEIIKKLLIDKSNLKSYKKWDIEFTDGTKKKMIMGFDENDLVYVILDNNNIISTDNEIYKSIVFFINLNTICSRQYIKSYDLSIFSLSSEGEYVL
jgi:hypothetical protein